MESRSETSKFQTIGTISKGSRFGVGSLIDGRAFDGLRTVSGVPAPSFLLALLVAKLWLLIANTIEWRPLLRKLRYSTFDYFSFFREGKEIGFDHFFRDLYPALSLYAAKLCSDSEAGKELASTAFMKVWEKRDRLSSPEHLKRYLYRAARNECYSWLRAKQKQLWMDKELSATLPAFAFDTDPLQALISAEVIADLHRQLQQLPAACREVFIKIYVEGRTVKETAEALHLHVSTVKTQKMRGLQLLRRNISLE